MALKDRLSWKKPMLLGNNGRMGRQNVSFFQRIHDTFSENEAQQVVRVYNCLVNHYGRTRSEHLRPAEILLEHHADYLIILSALLVPLRHDGYFTSKDILTRFGELPANLVENVYLQSPPADRYGRTSSWRHAGVTDFIF
jgi:hypothetical protein